MPVKKCEVCGSEFQARLSKIRTCGIHCRNQLISTEKSLKHVKINECSICKKKFLVGAADANRQTCSATCAAELRATKTRSAPKLECITCKRGFFTSLSRIDAGGGKYCSKQCMYDRNRKVTTRACECCGKQYKIPPPSQRHVRTCSPECGYKIRICTRLGDKVKIPCHHCGSMFEVYAIRASERKFCSHECHQASDERLLRGKESIAGALNPAWKGGVAIKTISATGKPYTRLQPHIEAEKIARRQRVRLQATPAWANLEKMQAIYKAAQAISKATGIAHHVDHMVPLTNPLVSGLHNEFNLRVLPATENLKKHNKHWPDMP
jgi:hypothetical protein